MRDFTLKKYMDFIFALLNQGYRFFSIEDYILLKEAVSQRAVIIRHDIDTKYDLPIAKSMAYFESRNSIKASYYFRTVSETLCFDTIMAIRDLGHEIGYHYEVMSLAQGDLAKAIRRFDNDLKVLRKVVPINTVCQHGGAMGYYNTTSVRGLIRIGWDYLFRKIKSIEYYPSDVIWDQHKYSDFKLLGDAYLSIDFEEVEYFSDTGQRWDSFSTRVLDKAHNYDESAVGVKTTNDLIKYIKKDHPNQLNILIHPANWHTTYYSWIKWRVLQKIRNGLKKAYKPTVHR